MKMVRLTGAEAIAKAMKESGVEFFFYVMGGMMIYSQIEEVGVKTRTRATLSRIRWNTPQHASVTYDKRIRVRVFLK